MKVKAISESNKNISKTSLWASWHHRGHNACDYHSYKLSWMPGREYVCMVALLIRQRQGKSKLFLVNVKKWEEIIIIPIQCIKRNSSQSQIFIMDWRYISVIWTYKKFYSFEYSIWIKRKAKNSNFHWSSIVLENRIRVC